MKGSFEGLKGYAVGRMTKSRRGKLYINDADWGPDAGSVEYGYRLSNLADEDMNSTEGDPVPVLH